MEQEINAQTKEKEDDEISLIDLFAVLLRYKKLVIITSVIAAIFAVIISIISLKLSPEKSFLPNVYSPSAHMLINNDSSSSGLSSMLSNMTGGLSSLIGISGDSSGGNSYSSLAVYLASSNPFLDEVVDKFDLIKRYKIKKFVKAESRKVLKKNLIATFDDETGVFTISFKDIDPIFAQSIVNYSVDYMERSFLEMGFDKNKIEKENLEKNIQSSYDEIINLQARSHEIENSVSSGMIVDMPAVTLQMKTLELELSAQQEVYKQLRSQYELLKIKMASETPIFQVLELAEVPDQKSGPSRGMLCIIIIFAAFFISIFLAFLLNAIENIKKDPEAMNKLKGVKRVNK